MTDDPIRDLRTNLLRTARRRHRPWWRRRPAALGLLAVLLVTAPAAAGIDALWRPGVKPLPPAATTVATAATSASESCVPGPFAGPRTTTATPPAELLGALAVLHAPETAQDRAGRRFARDSGSPRVAIAHVRYLGTDAGGGRQWIVPTLVLVRPRAATAHCPPRKAVRHWEVRTFGERGGGGAGDAETLVRRGSMGSSGPTDRESVVTGVAPDGVATVEVSYDGTAARSWPVRRNFYSFRVALDAMQAISADVVWKDAAGRVIKRIPHR